MSTALPKSFQFKLLSYCLSVVPFEVSNSKLVLITIVNVLFVLTEIIMELILHEEIFAFAGQPALMVLDCVAIIGPILVRILMILESFIKWKFDVKIWHQINEIDMKFGAYSDTLQKIFLRDFLLLTLVPSSVYTAVILATYRTQRNWALGIICVQFSVVFYHWGILMFIYYIRYIGDRLSQMAQEIEHLNDLTLTYKFSFKVAVERLYEMKEMFNTIWCLHGFANTRYEFFLVFYVFLSLCGLTTSMYFLGARLITRKFPYSFESALCLVPYLYTNVYISLVASDFGGKVEKLFSALQLLLDQNWIFPEVVSAVKSFKYQLISANLTTVVGGHLKVEYSNIILGVLLIATTNVFIFLFLN